MASRKTLSVVYFLVRKKSSKEKRWTRNVLLSRRSAEISVVQTIYLASKYLSMHTQHDSHDEPTFFGSTQCCHRIARTIYHAKSIASPWPPPDNRGIGKTRPLHMIQPLCTSPKCIKHPHRRQWMNLYFRSQFEMLAYSESMWGMKLNFAAIPRVCV